MANKLFNAMLAAAVLVCVWGMYEVVDRTRAQKIAESFVAKSLPRNEKVVSEHTDVRWMWRRTDNCQGLKYRVTVQVQSDQTILPRSVCAEKEQALDAALAQR